MAKMILSVDGGGIRGAAVTQFLTHVENQLQKEHKLSVRDCVDFYAGTSTGSIIALALATTDLTIAQINDLYNPDTAKEIFTENKVFPGIGSLGLETPKYEAGGKTKVLQTNFGSARINNVPQDKHVLAVTYGISQRQPQIIKSTKAVDRELFASAVADASSAAPTYFPTKELEIAEQDHWLIDGGVIANNPTMCAIAESRKVWHGTAMNDFRVLSIGTGYCTRKVNGPSSQKWGAIQWFTEGHILDILTDEMVVAYQAITIMKPGSYIRVNAEMRQQPGLPNPPDDAMDDVSASNISKLKKMGDWWFEQYGESVVQLLRDTYSGPSLDRINPATGTPMKHQPE
ncbi:patatin-like phospholipase family protein [Vibrio quintilis]|uniref:Patatin-like phospholipase n=1 Tax=Vibrio quintilis TaxID=1117707 RepID=A0A1M7YSX4_9VIBR|nr:patatin-like phospholipase family protein [Vibrio quintilis]SHO55723.1 Patatin-like phospholipase [Vibrio quintilis]